MPLYQAKHTFMILVMSVSRVKPAFAKGLEHKVSLYSITQIPTKHLVPILHRSGQVSK